jgi:cobalamin-dependent methionine synthase I
VTEDGQGRVSIAFTDDSGARRYLPVPEEEERTQEYEEGRIKHVRAAVRLALEGEGGDREVAAAYLRTMATSQIEAGAAYLDVNVDEYSHRLPEQIETMRSLVELLAPTVTVPFSIDSSNLEIIEAGLGAARGHVGPPMLNSASLERQEALDLALATGGPVVVTAAGEAGMPQDAEERVENASRMVELALAKGIAKERIFVDPLVFPIAVDGAFGEHCLAAIRSLRERYGPELHITGGMSNVSFGLPNRRLINDAFLLAAIDAGADSGIIDPVTSSVQRVLSLDRTGRPLQLAFDVLSGADRHCRAYMKAYRAGELGAA